MILCVPPSAFEQLPELVLPPLYEKIREHVKHGKRKKVYANHMETGIIKTNYDVYHEDKLKKAEKKEWQNS